MDLHPHIHMPRLLKTCIYTHTEVEFYKRMHMSFGEIGCRGLSCADETFSQPRVLSSVQVFRGLAPVLRASEGPLPQATGCHPQYFSLGSTSVRAEQC